MSACDERTILLHKGVDYTKEKKKSSRQDVQNLEVEVLSLFINLTFYPTAILPMDRFIN